jgi:2-methylcitrate synthase
MSEDIKKGLLGIVVDETEVSKVMPEINSLTYRGYAAQDLCEYCRFEEVAYLILNKDLPNSIQLKKFEKEERNQRELSKNLYEIIKHMPKKSHPMDVARTAVSVMGLEDKETSTSSPEANMRKALRIFAKTPTALAAFYRIRSGKKIIKPKKDFNFCREFFLYVFWKSSSKRNCKSV